ncbi:MAG: right-handed parallel beta-helix repeat-containing protein [Planctomycetota bacterium]
MTLSKGCACNASVLVAALAFWCSSPCSGQTARLVPADYATIQGAIAAAVSGDSVEVAPGTYVENIDLLGKTLLVHALGGPDVTVLDGSALTLGATLASTVFVRSGEGVGTEIRGFTIQGGFGSDLTDLALPTPWTIKGGGAYCLGSSVMFRQCRFSNNSAELGSAIYAANMGDLEIIDCEFRTNAAVGIGTINSVNNDCVRVIGCDISENFSYQVPIAGWFLDHETLIEDCVIADNESVNSGGSGGGFYFGGYTSPIVLNPAETTIRDCVFRNNEHPGAGAAVTASHFGTILFERCHFMDHISVPVATAEADATFRRCTFYGNVSSGASAVIAGSSPNSVVMEHCTISGNLGYEASIKLLAPCVATIRNTIIADDNVPVAILTVNNPTVTATYSNIQGGFPGIGNLDVPPSFVDAPGGVYYLTTDSLCVNAGDPASPLDPDGSIADMGAFPLTLLFKRGDANLDGNVDVGDPVALLNYLFGGQGGTLPCADAADSNDSGVLDIADAVFALNYLFGMSVQLPSPGPVCGIDGTADALTCTAPSPTCL